MQYPAGQTSLTMLLILTGQCFMRERVIFGAWEKTKQKQKQNSFNLRGLCIKPRVLVYIYFYRFKEIHAHI